MLPVEMMNKKVSMVSSAKRYVLCNPSKFSQIFCVKFAVFTHALIITTKVPEGRFSHCDNIVEVKNCDIYRDI